MEFVTEKFGDMTITYPKGQLQNEEMRAVLKSDREWLERLHGRGDTRLRRLHVPTRRSRNVIHPRINKKKTILL